MKFKILAVTLFLFVLMSGNTLAVQVTELSLENYGSSEGKYIDDSEYINAHFNCVGGDYNDAKINITKGSWWYSPSDFTETFLGDNTTQIGYNIDPDGLDGTGIYSFNGVCSGNGTDQETEVFKIYDLELNLISPTSTLELVQGDYMTTVFNFKKIIGSSTYDMDNAKFNVILTREGQELVISSNSEPNKVSGNLEIKSIISYIPSEKFYGLNDLTVEYSTRSEIKDSNEDIVKLNKAFELSFEDPTSIQMSSGGSLDVPVFVSCPKLGTEDLYDLEFDVDLDGSHEYIDGSEVSCSMSGTGLYRCVLPVSVPDKSAGSYELEIEGTYLSYYDSIEKEIYFTIPFEGELMYASGQIVNADIELQDMDTGKWYKTSVNSGTGKYSLDLLPGNYKLKMTCPQIEKIEIDGVSIGEGDEMITSNGPLSVDSFPGGESISGISSVKVVVFQFALEFDDAEIWMKYSDVDVPGSEEDMELYSCHDWNYGKRKCNGDWESESFNINMVTNIIHFNVTEFSAFILGNKKSMGMEITMDNDVYYSREYITFTGNVIDNEARAVENAKISYKIRDTSLSGSTYTDERGHFIAADLLAPSDEGTYVMEVTVEKIPYKEFTTTHPIKIRKKVEFGLIVPEEVSVNLDQSEQTTLKVVNTGQIDLGSISISARGISTEWYNIVPMTINNLTAGEEKTVTMNFKVPSEYCEEKCQIYHFVDITAKSDNGMEQMKSFTFQIKEGTEQEETSEGFSLPSFPTGNFVESISNPYVGVVIFIVVVFAFIFLMKRKDSGFGNKSYGGVKSFSNALSGGSLKPPTFFRKKQSYPNQSKRNRLNSRRVPRESIVPTLYEIKKSTRKWN